MPPGKGHHMSGIGHRATVTGAGLEPTCLVTGVRLPSGLGDASLYQSRHYCPCPDQEQADPSL